MGRDARALLGYLVRASGEPLGHALGLPPPTVHRCLSLLRAGATPCVRVPQRAAANSMGCGDPTASGGLVGSGDPMGCGDPMDCSDASESMGRSESTGCGESMVVRQFGEPMAHSQAIRAARRGPHPRPPLAMANLARTSMGSLARVAEARAHLPKRSRIAPAPWKVTGKGHLPEQPLIVKARYFTKEAEAKIKAVGGVCVLSAA